MARIPSRAPAEPRDRVRPGLDRVDALALDLLGRDRVRALVTARKVTVMHRLGDEAVSLTVGIERWRRLHGAGLLDCGQITLAGRAALVPVVLAAAAE